MVESSTKSRVKDQGGAKPRKSVPRHGGRQSSLVGDVDGVLVGKKVVVVVVVGSRTARVVGSIIAMGRYWVVVSVEESEIGSLRGVVYLNKGSIVAYVPLPDNNPVSNPNTDTRA